MNSANESDNEETKSFEEEAEDGILIDHKQMNLKVRNFLIIK